MTNTAPYAQVSDEQDTTDDTPSLEDRVAALEALHADELEKAAAAAAGEQAAAEAAAAENQDTPDEV